MAVLTTNFLAAAAINAFSMNKRIFPRAARLVHVVRAGRRRIRHLAPLDFFRARLARLDFLTQLPHGHSPRFPHVHAFHVTRHFLYSTLLRLDDGYVNAAV